jgi:GTP cyclohydrolase I
MRDRSKSEESPGKYGTTRTISESDWQRFEAHLAEILQAMGLPLDTVATRETPRRFLRALWEATEGYEGDPKLLTTFATECRGRPDCDLSQIIEGPIPFYSLCEHHALPFGGQVFVGYVAHETIIGLSKLTRLVRLYARRFTVQERLGQQIAGALQDMLNPHGVAVMVQAHHTCTQMRGVREIWPSTRTTVWRGHYAENAALREEFLRLIDRDLP